MKKVFLHAVSPDASSYSGWEEKEGRNRKHKPKRLRDVKSPASARRKSISMDMKITAPDPSSKGFFAPHKVNYTEQVN